MAEIFDAINNDNIEEVKRIVMENPNCVRAKDEDQWTPLDVAIAEGKLEIAKFLFEKGGRPNLDVYRDRNETPVHWAAKFGHTAILKWVFTEGGVLSLDMLNQDDEGWFPLDHAIMSGELETVQLLWEIDGRPTLDMYRDGTHTPVHSAAQSGYTKTLKWLFAKNVFSLDVLQIEDWVGRWTPLEYAIVWGKLETVQLLWEIDGRPTLKKYRDGEDTAVHNAAWSGQTKTLKWLFAENVFSLSVLQIKDEKKMTPLDVAIIKKKWETAALLRRLMYLDSVFLAMQRAKRDHHQMCVLRRLPNELLDMVVDEVARHFDLKVVW